MSEETIVVEEDLAPPCRNCGAPAPGTYCPQCGQETQARLPKFTQFMREAAGRYVALDGRLWKTLGALLFRPGYLTREYFAGRRRRYVRPARLFLVASVLLFAVLRMVVEMRDLVVFGAEPTGGSGAAATEGAPGKASAKEAATAEIAAEGSAAAPREQRKEPSAEASDREEGLRIEDVDLGIQLPAIKKRLDRFKHLSGPEREAQIADGIFRYGPYAMFVLLPAFALMLKLLYVGRARRHPQRPRLYSEHLVFAAHNHAFLFFAIVTAQLVVGILRAAVIVWILVYLLWSMRAVYGGSWVGIAARSFAIVVAYSVLFAFVTVGLVMAAVFLR